MNGVSEKTIGRLSLYRRLLYDHANAGEEHVFSHQLAALAGVTAAQVRRDVMAVGYNGSPTRGYDVRYLTEAIGQFMDAPEDQGVALIGMGNLGRAIIAFFAGRRPHLRIVAAFDSDPAKAGRVIQGCRCYPVDELDRVVDELGICVAVLAVPASEAQATADRLVRAGIRGVLNFTLAPLRLPPDVYVEGIDMTMSLEKVAYFARQKELQKW